MKEKYSIMDIDDKHTTNHSDEEEFISEEERAYIRNMIEKLMEKGIFVVYGDESDEEKTVLVDPECKRDVCKAVCCSFVFALTKKEVEKGIIKWNPKRPYFIARDDDGYCPHLDRESLLCKIWEDRPERCRKYDCREDQNVWIDWEKKVLNKNVFKHLPE
jgi:Fe-S-cluster containining protein